jgi:hypothetical protein
MSRRTAHARDISREEACCINFDAALVEYLEEGHAGGLLLAANLVAGSATELDPKCASIVAGLTGCTYELADYDDAGRAVRRWFATMAQPGARH